MAEYFPIDVNFKSYSGSFSGSFFGDGSGITGISASNAISASYALTASFALNGGGGTAFPYTGSAIITGSLVVTGSTYLTDSIYFSGSGPASRLVWNNTDGTLDLGLKGGNVTLQIGQEQVVRVVNKTGANLLESEYKAVRIRRVDEGGAQGQRLAIVLAQANNDDNSVDTLGLVTENINVNEEGFITNSGLVRGINTTGTLQGETWVDGDPLYLSPTTPGSITKVKPQAPQHTVTIGYVVYAHVNNGKIFVKVDNGYEIDELHNVRINTGSLTSGDLLVYSSSVWVNTKQLTGSYGLTGSLTATSFTGSLLGTSSWATNALTASFLNTLNQDLTFNGNLTLNGTASISTLVVNQTQYSSGSNQLGDAANDTQTLYGTVRIPTGSLIVTGSVNVSGSSSISGPLTVSFGNIVGGTALYANGNTIHNIGRGIYTTGYAYGIQGNQTMVNNWGSQPDAAGVHGTGQIGVYGSGSIAGFSGPSAFFTTLTGATRQGARLVSSLVQVRGSGATSATTALLVENTNGSASLVVLDDRNATFYNGLTVNNNLTVTGSIRYAISGFGNYTLNNAWTDSVNNNSISLYDNNGNISIAASPSAFNRSIILRPTSVYGGAGVLIGPYVTGNGTIWPNILNVSGSSNFIGKVTITSSINTAISGSILTVIGSGSAQPIFTVRGSQGELFSVTDSLSGSLFSVNDISGLPILEVFSDNTTLIGDYLDPMLITTKKVTMTNSGSFVVYSLPTASYDTAFFDYSIKSGSNARAGQIMAIQSGTSVNFTETTTTDFGNTTAVSFTVLVSGSNMVLTGSAATGSWTIKSIIRGI
jgi:hypothetical protein